MYLFDKSFGCCVSPYVGKFAGWVPVGYYSELPGDDRCRGLFDQCLHTPRLVHCKKRHVRFLTWVCLRWFFPGAFSKSKLTDFGVSELRDLRPVICCAGGHVDERLWCLQSISGVTRQIQEVHIEKARNSQNHCCCFRCFGLQLHVMTFQKCSCNHWTRPPQKVMPGRKIMRCIACSDVKGLIFATFFACVSCSFLFDYELDHPNMKDRCGGMALQAMDRVQMLGAEWTVVFPVFKVQQTQGYLIYESSLDASWKDTCLWFQLLQ